MALARVRWGVLALGYAHYGFGHCWSRVLTHAA